MNRDNTVGVRIVDQRPIILRRIRPEDEKALQEMHDGLSPDTIRLRFMGAKPALSAKDAHYLCDLDHHRCEALVLETGGQLIGAIRYAHIDDDMAEVALVVADAWQHKGLGRWGLRHLAKIAAANGYCRLKAEMLGDNHLVINLLDSEFERLDDRRPGCGTLVVVYALSADAPAAMAA